MTRQHSSHHNQQIKGDIQIIQPQQRNRIIHIKPKRQGAQEILALLQRPRIGRDPRVAQLDRLVLDVHAHLQLQVLAQRRVDLRPGRLDRAEAVRRDGDFAGFDVHQAPGSGVCVV